MIFRMGSKTALSILEWMRGRKFTRSDIEAHLGEIGFTDPYAAASLQSPIERIMQSIKRNGYASCKGKIWESNDSVIDSAIKLHRSMPVEEAGVILQRMKENVKAMLGDLGTEEAVDEAIVQYWNSHRSSRSQDDDIDGLYQKIEEIIIKAESLGKTIN